MKGNKLYLNHNIVDADIKIAIMFPAMGIETDQEMIQLVGKEAMFGDGMNPTLHECTREGMHTQMQARLYLGKKPKAFKSSSFGCEHRGGFTCTRSTTTQSFKAPKNSNCKGRTALSRSRWPRCDCDVAIAMLRLCWFVRQHRSLRFALTARSFYSCAQHNVNQHCSETQEAVRHMNAFFVWTISYIHINSTCTAHLLLFP